MHTPPSVFDEPRANRLIPRISPLSGLRATALAICLCGCGFAQTAAQQSEAPEPTVPEQAAAEESPTDDKPDPRYPLVEGQITDAIGSGLSGVTVVARHKGPTEKIDGDTIATTQTTKYGDFVIHTAQPMTANVVITFSKKDYAELRRTVYADENEPPPYVGESLAGDLTVSGTVRSALGNKPIENALVTLDVGYDERNTTTDAAGRFTLTELSPGPVTLKVEAEGFGRETDRIDDLEGLKELLFELKPERIVHLDIFDDLGKPVPGVAIEVYDQPRDDFRAILTDEHGKATLRGLHFDAETLDLRLTHEKHVSSTEFDRTIELPESAIESTHRLELQRAGSIRGLVTDLMTRQPLPGARAMTGERATPNSPRDWADYEGKFAIHGVPPGETVVTVHLAGYAPTLETVRVSAGETIELRIKLGPPARVSGVVTSADGTPVPDVRIETTRWRGHGTLDLRARTDLDGRFVIGNAPHDEFEVAILTPRGGRSKRTVKANSEQPITIQLAAGEAAAKPPGSTALKVGDDSPPITITTMDGRKIELAKLEGKTVLIDFWATWCGPCVAELPELIKIHEAHNKREDFLMVGISLDGDEKAFRRFLKKRKIDWPQAIGEKSGVDEAADKFGAQLLPALFLIDPTGKISASGLSAAAVAKLLEERFAKGKSP